MSFKNGKSGAATGATLGSWLGPLGLLFGGLGGGLYGMYNSSKAGPPAGQFNQNTGMYSGSNIFSGMTPDQMSSWFTTNPQWNPALNVNGNPFLLPQLQSPQIASSGSAGSTNGGTSGYMGNTNSANTGLLRFSQAMMGLNNEGFWANPIDKVQLSNPDTGRKMTWINNPFSGDDSGLNPILSRLGLNGAGGGTTPLPTNPGYPLASNFQNPFYQPPTGNNSFQYF